MTRIRLGFFESFKGADTLLLDGDAEGFVQLAKRLHEFAASQEESLALHELPFVDARGGIRLVAKKADRDVGVTCARSSEFVWGCSNAGWEDAADLVVVLSERRGHQYLDERRFVRVMASRDEYGDEWWSRD